MLMRDEAYIGVLIDDLITKGTKEPYRMFTSRAEYRILLRQDNADIRLTPKSHELGLADEKRMRNVSAKMEQTERVMAHLRATSVAPEDINPLLESKQSSPVKQKVKLHQILARPQVSMTELRDTLPELNAEFSTMETERETSIEQAEIRIKYQGYLDQERERADKLQGLENIRLNPDFDYSKLAALSSEAREKLARVKPATIGQAARISGVSPSDVNVLMVYLGR